MNWYILLRVTTTCFDLAQVAITIVMPCIAYIVLCSIKSILNLNTCVMWWLMAVDVYVPPARIPLNAIGSSIRALCDIDLVSKHTKSHINTHSVRFCCRLSRVYRHSSLLGIPEICGGRNRYMILIRMHNNAYTIHMSNSLFDPIRYNVFRWIEPTHLAARSRFIRKGFGTRLKAMPVDSEQRNDAFAGKKHFVRQPKRVRKNKFACDNWLRVRIVQNARAGWGLVSFNGTVDILIELKVQFRGSQSWFKSCSHSPENRVSSAVPWCNWRYNV